MASTTYLSAPNLIDRIVSFFRNLLPTIPLHHKAEFDRVYNALYRKLTIDTDFGDHIVELGMRAKWSKFVEHSVGEITHKNFFTSGNIMSAQAFWAKDATVFRHCHSNADQYIYLIDGRMEVTLEDGKKVDIVYPDADNPYIIPAGVSHIIKALENSVLVAKFVIKD